MSFRNYADYALSASFRNGLEHLLDLGRDRRCTVMCAEAVWWRCHRRIIADYLILNGAAVFHIMGLAQIKEASLTPAANETAEGLIYRSPPN